MDDVLRSLLERICTHPPAEKAMVSFQGCPNHCSTCLEHGESGKQTDSQAVRQANAETVSCL